MSQLSGKPKRFEYFEHPADIGLRIYGKNLPFLFENAVIALYDVIKPSVNPDSREYKEKIGLISDSIEELLISFLNEILFLAMKRHLIFQKFFININCSENENNLNCEMTGKQIFEMKREVKAVTYHRIRITRKSGYFVTDIVLDI